MGLPLLTADFYHDNMCLGVGKELGVGKQVVKFKWDDFDRIGFFAEKYDGKMGGFGEALAFALHR